MFDRWTHHSLLKILACLAYSNNILAALAAFHSLRGRVGLRGNVYFYFVLGLLQMHLLRNQVIQILIYPGPGKN